MDTSILQTLRITSCSSCTGPGPCSPKWDRVMKKSSSLHSNMPRQCLLFALWIFSYRTSKIKLRVREYVPELVYRTGREPDLVTDFDSASTIGLDESTSAMGFESASIIGMPLSASTRTAVSLLLHSVSGLRIDQRLTGHSQPQAAYEDRRIVARAHDDLRNTDGINTSVWHGVLQDEVGHNIKTGPGKPVDAEKRACDRV